MQNIQADPSSRFTVGSPWRIDTSQGDVGHPGLKEAAVGDNSQSRNSLRGYDYLPHGDNDVEITGTICGAAAFGPGAIFDRQYLVYETAPP